MINLNKEILRGKAASLGFMDARVAPAILPPEPGTAYDDWLGAGYHGEMSYMARNVDERKSGADHVLSGAQSVIVLAASYYKPIATTDEATDVTEPNPDKPLRIARYALGVDYHYVLKDRLAELIAWFDSEFPGYEWRAVTDSAPILERSYALASGLGFIGKNTMLISWMSGSFTLLAEIVTTAPIEPDATRDGTCGNCTRCLDACPTQAFPRAGVLDARKCISYLTIEKRTELTDSEVQSTGEWVFGCDICQDVCPYNKGPQVSQIEQFKPGTIINQHEPAHVFLEPQSNRQFERRFHASPLLRAGKRRLQNLISLKSGDTKPDK